MPAADVPAALYPQNSLGSIHSDGADTPRTSGAEPAASPPTADRDGEDDQNQRRPAPGPRMLLSRPLLLQSEAQLTPNTAAELDKKLNEIRRKKRNGRDGRVQCTNVFGNSDVGELGLKSYFDYGADASAVKQSVLTGLGLDKTAWCQLTSEMQRTMGLFAYNGQIVPVLGVVTLYWYFPELPGLFIPTTMFVVGDEDGGIDPEILFGQPVLELLQQIIDDVVGTAPLQGLTDMLRGRRAILALRRLSRPWTLITGTGAR
jgi:hypothetical protein